MKIIIFIIIVFLIKNITVYNQSSIIPDSTLIHAMSKINFLKGKWSGEGWIQMGKGKEYFSQTESVVQKANGTVITIDGLGIDKSTNKIIHDAFAVISYDLTNNKYLMRAFKSDGKYIDADASFDKNGNFVWNFVHPLAGQTRYTITHIDNKWVERGEMSKDGINWFQFFEMTLSKE